MKHEDIKILYKYRFFDCKQLHIRTIENNEFYFASRKELNDPFDLAFKPDFLNASAEDIQKYIENIKKQIKKYGFNYKLTIDLDNISIDEKRKFINNNFMNVIDKTGICSFAANQWNNILMWSHYCNSNTGFCIGLNYNKFRNFLEKDRNNNPLYNKEFHVVQYIEAFDSINPFTKLDNLNYVFEYKYIVWNYENEIRLLAIDLDKKSRIFKIHDDIIEEVILGLNCDIKNQDLIIRILKNRNQGIKLYKIIQKPNSFEFDREQIDY